ncbi:MAG: signal peptidase I [Deltaproteobacteria bacterium]|nr:signal peptidase I [Deltaproteobacteria bacterium]
MNTFLTISKELFEQGKSVRFEARGWSMRPLIRDGDFVIARPIDSTSVKIGDIVFYITDNNGILVHRIIGLRRDDGEMTAMIKGDACFGPPDNVPVQNIFGRVVSIERKGREKRFDTAWQRALSLILVAAAPLTLWGLPILSRAKRMLLSGR